MKAPDRLPSRPGNPLFAALASPRLQQMARFGLSGIVATAIYFVLVNMFVLMFATRPAAASIYSYVISLAFSYALQSRFTFLVRRDSREQIVRFALVTLTGLAVSFGAMEFFSRILGASYFWGALSVCILIPAINFLAFKHWVFTKNESPVELDRHNAACDGAYAEGTEEIHKLRRRGD